MSGRKRKHPTKDDSVGTAKRQNVGKQKPKQKAKKSINTKVTQKGKQTATKNEGTSGTFSLPDLITNDGWKVALSEELEKDYVKELEKKLTQHYQGGDSVYPPMELIFNALNMTPLDKVNDLNIYEGQ